MKTETIRLLVDDTQEIRLFYHHPKSGVDWGMSLEGSDIVQDLRTPIILFLSDYPGGEFSSHDNLFPELAQSYTDLGLPCLGLEYRGCGITSRYAGHFTLNSAVRDIEIALLWAMHEKGYSAFMPVTAGVSALIAMKFINKYKFAYEAKPHYYGEKKSLLEALEAQEGKTDWQQLDPKILANLRLTGMQMFWPWLDRDSNAFINYYKQGVDLGEESFDDENTAPKFVIDDNKTDISARIAGEEYKIGLRFLHQVTNLDPLELIEKLKCPLLIQHGEQDEVSRPINLQTLSRHISSEYLDFQTYQGHGHGLAKKSIRPFIKSVTKDFIKRFA